MVRPAKEKALAASAQVVWMLLLVATAVSGAIQQSQHPITLNINGGAHKYGGWAS